MLKRRLPLAAAVLLAVAVCVILGQQGCVTVKSAEMREVRELLFQEAGFNLAFYTMGRESEEAIARVERTIQTGLQLVETTSVNEMVILIVEYIETAPQFRGRIREYEQLIESAKRLFKGLLEIELELPAEAEYARRMIRTFFGGALEGIAAVRKLKDEMQAERSISEL